LTQYTYKWVKVDRETMWSAEGKSGIRWRNASRSGAKFSECRTFTITVMIQLARAIWYIPRCMLAMQVPWIAI
jgi:hypothetical protein